MSKALWRVLFDGLIDNNEKVASKNIGYDNFVYLIFLSPAYDNKSATYPSNCKNEIKISKKKT